MTAGDGTGIPTNSVYIFNVTHNTIVSTMIYISVVIVYCTVLCGLTCQTCTY